MEAKLEFNTGSLAVVALKHSGLCSNLPQAENERVSDNSELFSAEATLISVTRVAYGPEVNVQRGLCLVLRLTWVLVQMELSARFMLGASANVGACPGGIVRTVYAWCFS